MIFRKYKKTPSSSGGRNFTNFWSSRILKYTGHVYSSRALHFWHLFLSLFTLNPSNPTKHNLKNGNFSFGNLKSWKIMKIQIAKTEFSVFKGYVWSGLEGSEWGYQEINARNGEISMSRRAQYILKFSNSKNSKSYGLLKSAAFWKNQAKSNL